MSLLATALARIESRFGLSNSYKIHKLKQLKEAIADIQKASKVSVDELLELRAFCLELLQDERFTYKQCTLFYSESNCTRIAKNLVNVIEARMGELLFEKLPADLKGINKAACLNAIKTHKYQARCLAALLAKTAAADSALAIMQQWLEEKRRISKLDTTKLILQPAIAMTGWLEDDASQLVYDIESLRLVLSRQPIGKEVGFIYVIDADGNPFFSKGTEMVDHCNLCNREDCLGAGEVYFTKVSDDRILVNLVNNRSGLYRPTMLHCKSLVSYLVEAGYQQAKDFCCVNEARKSAGLMDPSVRLTLR